MSKVLSISQPQSAAEARPLWSHSSIDLGPCNLTCHLQIEAQGRGVDIYERGVFELSHWMKVVRHEHLLRFVVEQFPPLDFMNTFGGAMVAAYNDAFRAPSDAMYGHGLHASGLLSRDQPWPKVLHHLPQLTALNPGIHPLVQARAIGIQLLATQETPEAEASWQEVKTLALQGLQEDLNIWPRWAHQNCYFAFNMADWAVLSGDRQIIEAVSNNIAAFRTQQDWYNRSTAIETILSIRQVWNWISLHRYDEASHLMRASNGRFNIRRNPHPGMWHHGTTHPWFDDRRCIRPTRTPQI